MTLSCTHIGVSQPRCPQIDGTFSFQTKLLEREYCADFEIWQGLQACACHKCLWSLIRGWLIPSLSLSTGFPQSNYMSFHHNYEMLDEFGKDSATSIKKKVQNNTHQFRKTSSKNWSSICHQLSFHEYRPLTTIYHFDCGQRRIFGIDKFDLRFSV